MDSSSTWFVSDRVLPEHSDLQTKQVYIWLCTQDHNVAIVSKDGAKWQLPGGKPKEGETLLETMKRELKEETGVDFGIFNAESQMFGYYIVNEGNQTYLQLRFVVKSNLMHAEISMKPQENPIDPSPIIEAKFVELGKIAGVIPWMKDSQEFLTIKTYLDKQNGL